MASKKLAMEENGRSKAIEMRQQTANHQDDNDGVNGTMERP